MSDDFTMLNQRLTEHITDCNARFDEGSRQFQELIQCTQANTEATNRLVTETTEVVQLYKDLQGVVRIGVVAQKFGVWVIKWPLIGVGIVGIIKWFQANFFGA